ncbi:hypothetical protein [Occultella kanbiaonis]|uniref:hypothetical protein n=1 Tax=Occultella kanbiaonis TaxID=2675754 RepID=UPI0012B86D72|nr:hypothetical protein [Occultella kanbiaonis]
MSGPTLVHLLRLEAERRRVIDRMVADLARLTGTPEAVVRLKYALTPAELAELDAELVA